MFRGEGLCRAKYSGSHKSIAEDWILLEHSVVPLGKDKSFSQRRSLAFQET
jgi:hypothetical protein